MKRKIAVPAAVAAAILAGLLLGAASSFTSFADRLDLEASEQLNEAYRFTGYTEAFSYMLGRSDGLAQAAEEARGIAGGPVAQATRNPEPQ